MIKETVLSNRSYRSFSDTKISKEQLLDMVDTARKVPSARNLQPLKYRLCYTDDDCARLLPLTAWAGALRPLVLPPKGHEPKAYIIICTDSEISPEGTNRFIGVDIGIAAQTIMLKATEMGLGGCMIGAFKADEVATAMEIDKRYTPALILALGCPDEKVVLEDADSIEKPYYRDSCGQHHVPKRKLEDILI